MGRRAASAAAALEPLLDDPDKDGVAMPAATALASVGGPARAAAILPRVREWEREYAFMCYFASAGPGDAADVPALLARLDESPVAISRALAEIGPAARDALPRLEKRMRIADAEQRIAAAEAVLRIGGDRRAALDVLVGELDPSRGTWNDLYDPAAWALARSGEAARPAVQALRDAARSDGIVAALARVTDGAEPDISQMESILEANPPIEFVEALGSIGPGAARLVPPLERVATAWERETFKDFVVDLSRAAIRALGEIGPGAASALPSLRKLRRNALFRAEADEAIRRIGAK